MGQRLSLEEVKQVFIDRGYIPLFNEYKNTSEKLLIQSKEGYKFLVSFKHFVNGHNPPIAHSNNSFSIYNIKIWLKINNKKFIILSDNYINAREKLNFKCLIDNQEFEATWDKIYFGRGCPKCGGTQKLSLQEIKSRLLILNKNIEILSNEYINSHSYLLCKCKICNHEWESKWGDLSQGYGCPKCCNNSNIVDETNCLNYVRPDLIQYLKNKNDGLLYKEFSSKTVVVKCPICGNEKNMIISNLSKQGFSCNICSDGISIPNKFIRILLGKINLNFKNEKRFKWSKNKIYDNYIKEYNLIIEAHGIQHYDRGFGGRTLEEEQENDKIKKELALQNGIKEESYIVLDCRKSELEWIKNSILNSKLNDLFDLSNIDWKNIWLLCQKSIVIESWNFWNNREYYDTTTTIAKKLGISSNSVIRYLKIGNKLKKCDYDPIKEKIKVISRNGKANAKKILQIDIDGNIVDEFDSSMDAYRKTNISFGNICSVLRGEKLYANGFSWIYSK